MRSGERLVISVMLVVGLLSSAVYVATEHFDRSGSGPGSSAAGPAALGWAPGLGMEASPWADPIPEPPDQRGWVSHRVDGSSAEPVSVDGGLTGPPDTPVPVTPVESAVEGVALLDSSGAAVDLDETIGDSPVTVEVLSNDGMQVSASESPTLEVSVVDDEVAATAGFDKVAFTVAVAGLDDSGLAGGLSTSDASALKDAVDIRLSVDYSAFTEEFGANWAGRLRLVRFAPCALTPGVAGCDGPQVVDSFVNDAESRRMVVTLPLDALVGAEEVSAGRSEPTSLSASSPSGTTSGFALMAGASSSSGDYSTTSLNPAGSWAVGTQSGNFSWSYPISVPAPPAGSAPGVAVSHSSQAIDGLTADENTQGGVLGPGWSMSNGFIERQYRPCRADGGVVGDLCWFSDNATFSFGGMNAELIRVGTEASGSTGWEAVVYRMESHGGWIVKKYRGVNLGYRLGSLGSDNDSEYWLAISPDGTRYFFGYGKESGSLAPGTVLGSVQTVPVVGNHAGEPCNTLANNWCHQAYRWSLDRIEDPNGRVTTFHYTQEVNHYGVKGSPGWSEPYVSGAVLVRIEYGQLSGSAVTPDWYTHAVTFNYQYRCNNPPAGGTCATAPTTASGASFPDVPNDQLCPDSYCTNYSPTFFERRMLASIVTKVRDPAGTLVNAGQDIFAYNWVDPDGGAAGSDPPRLWLRTIQHRGLQDGGSIYMPAVRFDESPAMENRVDYNDAGGVTRMRYYRVGKILDEYGGEIRVGYTRPKPCPSPWPSTPPSGWTSFVDNSWSCFARYWVPPSGPAGMSVWHKWVVDSVTVVDQSGATAATTKVFDYQYPQVSGSNGGMAWHSDTNVIVPVAQRSWAEYRGFERVRVVVGHPDELNRVLTDYTFHRGMDGDINSHSNPDGVPKDDVDTPSSLGPVADADQLAGRERELIVRNVVGGAAGTDVYSGAVTYYTSYATAGTGATSWQVETNSVRTRSAYGGVVRYGRVDHHYDTHAWMRRPIKMIDWGRVTSAYGNAVGDDGLYDDSCSTISYTPVSATGGRFLNGLPHRQALFGSSDCASYLLSDARTYYDGGAVTAVAAPPAPAAPAYGNPTAVWRATGGGVVEEATGTAPPAIVERTAFGNNGFHATSPSWSRPTSITDARGFQTTFTYTPFSSTVASFGARYVTVRNALGHQATTELDLHGNQIRATDPNNRSSYVCHDALGRVTRVYHPDTAGGSTCGGVPSITYAHTFIFVTANQATSAAVPRWAIQTRELFAADADSFNPLAAGDAYLESWMLFDGFGRPAQTNTASPAGGRIATRTRYDAQDNPVRVSQPFHSTAAPGAAWTIVNDAQVPRETRTTFDAVGRPALVEQLDNNAAIRSTATTYTPDRVSMLAPVATGSPWYGRTTNFLDADGQVWKVTEQSNAGADRDTRYRYDHAGRLLSITDSAGNLTTMTYNLLGWRIALNDPNAGRSDTSFYPSGEVRYTADGANRVIYTRIDQLGRPIATHSSIVYTDANRLSYFDYDGVSGGVGALTQADSFWPTGTLSTRTETTAFDTAGRPTTTRVTVPAANGPDPGDDALAGPHLFVNRYTRNGAVYQQVYPGVAGSNLASSETVTAVFNSQGLPIELGGAGLYTDLVEYDNVGRAMRTTMGSAGQQAGLVVTNTFQDADGRLSRIHAATRAGQLVQDDTYTYDAPGNPTRITHSVHPEWVANETECFEYDHRQRLQHAFTLAGNVACPVPGTTVTATGPAPFDLRYTIDQVGRITNFEGHTRTHGVTPTGTCRAGSQLTKPHALVSSTGGGISATYGYDCNGAVTQQVVTGGPDAGTTTYGWDHQQRLRSVTTAAGTTTNTYDTTNNRVLRVDPDGTRTVYLGATEARWSSADGVQVSRTYGETRREFNGTLTTFTLNHQGSIAATTSSAATAPDLIRYTPYGTTRTIPNGRDDLDDRNFLGLPDDPNTNTNYLNNRHYLPDHGVFVSVDPIVVGGQPASLNPYVYSLGNPIAMSDATGLLARCDEVDCVTPGQRPGSRRGVSAKATDAGSASSRESSWRSTRGSTALRRALKSLGNSDEGPLNGPGQRLVSELFDLLPARYQQIYFDSQDIVQQDVSLGGVPIQQLAFCEDVSNIFNCIKALDIRERVLADPWSAGDSSQYNAYQHIMLAGLLTVYLGVDEARELLDAHEGVTADGIAMAPWDGARMMDIINNEVGIQIGMSVIESNDGDLSDQPFVNVEILRIGGLIHQETLAAIESGEAVWIADPRNPPGG